MNLKSYDEWEAEQGISPVSPESHYAEAGWNAALEQVQQVLAVALAAEGGNHARALVLVQAEVDGLKTD